MKHFTQKLAFLIFIFWSSSGLTQNIGPFSVNAQFCRDTQKLGSIINSFQLTQWPVAGLPGIVMGVSQRTSPIMDMCQFIINLENASLSSQLLTIADQTNKMTDSKWSDEITLTKNTFRLANSYYDFNRGKKRPGAISARDHASRIGTYMAQFGRMKKKWDKEAATREEKLANEEKINRLAEIAKQRAVLGSILSCPDDQGNPDYDEIYRTKYIEPQKQLDKAKEQVEFAKYQLLNMGMKFIPKIEKYKEYDVALNEIIVNGVTYSQTLKTNASEKTTVKTGKLKESGEAETATETVTRPIYIYSTNTNATMFNSFTGKYEFEYRNWVRSYWASVSRQRNGEARLREEFKTMKYDCNPEKLMGDMSEFDDNYDFELKKRKEQCAQQLKTSMKETEGLFREYVKIIRENLEIMKRNQALIWSMDSEYLKKNRVISTAMKDGYTSETVACSKELQIADMELLSIKQAQTSAETESIIAEEITKQNTMMEAQEEERRRDEERNKIEAQMIERDIENEKAAIKESSAAVEIKGGM